MLATSFFVLAWVAYVHGNQVARPPICEKPPNLGLCKPLNQSWYYDPPTHKCFMIPRGQCGGGPNIFPTEMQCLSTCRQSQGMPQPRCLQKPLLGSCQPTDTAWLYHPKHRDCKMFRHGSCGRGLNHFATEEKCRMVCEQRKKPPIPICSAKPEAGYCMGMNTYWYFDQKANNCSHFEGWWCAKNANGFISYNVCMWRCSYKPIPKKCPQCQQKKPAQLPDQRKSAVKGSNVPPGLPSNQLPHN
ncbi:papilin-like [Dermacentor andersoni]|uniref:papilin-like n=1 Tax=Dermacentor andersoni TaxID=34620 RepID=UPI003B3B862D